MRWSTGASLPGLDAGIVGSVAEAGGCDTAVDVGGDTPESLDGDYSLCNPSESELAVTVDGPLESIADVVAAASELRHSGFERVAVSLGGDGAVLVGADESYHAEAPSVEVVDTVGAGDALLAGLLAAFDNSADDSTALSQAVAVGSFAVTEHETRVLPLRELQSLAETVVVEPVDDARPRRE
ncbi:PfkB family carbohydrate kinase [Halomicroarcula sp. S1AR25-4]|uniref:PfkB family carbohydrate kinase n=1 Tax=Haloarcula sp. S1AR25-4 TaxID=2950538 RepID=UPI002875DE43|nr:PfkB family carbohydrate kinase [Halomicroarcula sp. S1AR25-4]MDS0279809.1 PfkB family carbohydrate kinase [Halomicroarcula sp. S1AR25-4]